jgi:hypothetical protein
MQRAEVTLPRLVDDAAAIFLNDERGGERTETKEAASRGY